MEAPTLTLGGESHQSLVLTNVSKADLLVAGVDCELTMFLVGGVWEGAGGGSGYLLGGGAGYRDH